MPKNRFRDQIGLGVLLWLGFSLFISVVPGQSGPLDDYTFTLGIWGNSREQSRMGREDIIAREGFCPSGGCILRLDGVTVRPNQARRGDTLRLSTTYTILTPEQVAMPVASEVVRSLMDSTTGWKPALRHTAVTPGSPAHAKIFSPFASAGVRTSLAEKK